MTREQEVKLINIGLNYILHGYNKGEELVKSVKPKRKYNLKKKSKFTKAQRIAISERMRKMWAAKNKSK